MKNKKKIQQAARKFLYSGKAINNTTMEALNKLSIKGSQATEETQGSLEIFMDYLYTNPDTKIIFRASDMQLHIHNSAAYLVHPKARSRTGGCYYLGNFDKKLFNGRIYILAKVMKALMLSAADAECGSLYINTLNVVPFIITIWELGHPQQPVSILTDNSTAYGIMNKIIKRKQSKAFEMQSWWLVNRVE